ncbi:MAG: hypothetical protein H5T84_04360, partial [Thermoleophilia bacterium]|nr:hypothetical protein [Thermoleophilia bacterium]
MRTTVIETAQALAEALRHTHAQLTTIRNDLNALIGLKVDEVNTLARQIADLNKQIVTIKAAGMSPNDLLDRRDLLLDELGKIVAIEVEPVTVDRGGETYDTGAVKVKLREVTVTIDSEPVPVVLVDWDDQAKSAVVKDLKVEETSDPLLGTPIYRVYWLGDDDQETLPPDKLYGELGGLFYARDDLLRDEYLTKLDDFATALASEVNAVHAGGRGLDGDTGRPFFVKDAEGSVQDQLHQV